MSAIIARARSLLTEKRALHSLTAGRALTVLAVPMTLQAALSALVLLIDIYFVAQLGTASISALGWVTALTAALGVLVTGVGLAVTTLIANSYASEDAEARRRAFSQVLATSLLLSLIVPLLGWLSYRPFLYLFGAPPAIIDHGEAYAAWMIFGYPAVLMLFIFNCILRGAGRPGLALRALVIACAFNAILNPILIFGFGPIPAFGLAGAGAASVAGRLVGAIYQAFEILSGRNGFPRLSPRHLRVPVRDMMRLMKMAAGGTAQSALILASSLFVLKIIGLFGTAAVAGYVVASRVLMFAGLPLNGVSTAAAVLAGQHVPAARRRYAVKVIHRASLAGIGIALFLGGIMLVATEYIVAPFGLDAEARWHATSFIMISATFLPAMAVAAIMVHVANGVGRLRRIAVVQGISLIMVQFPATFALTFLLHWNTVGVWLGVGLGQLALAIMATSAVRRFVSPRVLAGRRRPPRHHGRA